MPVSETTPASRRLTVTISASACGELVLAKFLSRKTQNALVEEGIRLVAAALRKQHESKNEGD